MLRNTIIIVFCLLSVLKAHANSISTEDSVEFGKARSNASKVLQFGTDKSSPKLKATPSERKIEFSNDGTNFIPLATGAEGFGYNVMSVNPDFEFGKQGWTANGGDFTIFENSPQVLFGKASASFQSKKAGDSIESQYVDFPSGLQSQSCMVKFYYSTSSSNFKAQVLNDTGKTVGDSEGTIFASVAPKVHKVVFDCPTTSKIKLKISAGEANSSLIFDRVYVGEADSIPITSEAEFYAGVTIPPGEKCLWSTVATGYNVENVKERSDICKPAIISGNVVFRKGGASTGGFFFSQMPPGNYLFTVGTALDMVPGSDEKADVTYCSIELKTNSLDFPIYFKKSWPKTFGPISSYENLVGHLEVKDKGDQLFQLSIRSISNASRCTISSNGGAGLTLKVFRFPLRH